MEAVPQLRFLPSHISLGLYRVDKLNSPNHFFFDFQTSTNLNSNKLYFVLLTFQALKKSDLVFSYHTISSLKCSSLSDMSNR